MKKNSITLGIPFYSRTNSSYFDSAIKSVLDQTLQPDKIHLIQDGEVGEDLNKLVQKYINMYQNLIQLISLPKKGLPYALNQSIKQSQTEFYARMDSDDVLVNSRLKEQINFFNNNKDIEILGTWSFEFEKKYINESLYINKTPNNKNTIENYVHYRNPLVHPSVMFKMNVFNKIGYYNENLFTDQDLELWGRSLKQGIKISNIQKPLIYLRIENRGLRRSKFPAIKRQIIIRYSYNTSSLKLNVLKLAAIILRVLPIPISDWCYRNLRNL
jgi:glycosyltransferase involved in cell wall biosynthesis